MVKCFGTVYRFHPLFILIMLSSVFTGYFIELLTLFGVVLIHEIGHVAAARSLGWSVPEVELLPFGGVAKVEDADGSVWAEIGVALAGPLQNLLMAGLALFCRWAGIWDEQWGHYFLTVNAMIGLFNLLPVLPLDGGRVVQALCSLWLPYHRALSVTTWASLAAGTAFTTAAVWADASPGLRLNILIIGGFLIFSNWYGYRHFPYYFIRFLMKRELAMRAVLDKRSLMKAEMLVVKMDTRMSSIVKQLKKQRYHLIYVLADNGTLRGVIPEHRLLNGYLIELKPESAVSDLFM